MDSEFTIMMLQKRIGSWYNYDIETGRCVRGRGVDFRHE